MTVMQCPIGHPPGPQRFCPICGRQCTPVVPGATPPPDSDETPTSSWETRPREATPAADPPPASPFDLDAPTEGAPPPPLPPPLAPPAPPLGGPPPSPFTPAAPPGESHGPDSAAAKARDLIAELSGTSAATAAGIPTQPPGGAPPPPGPFPPAPPGAPAAPYLPSGPVAPSFGAPGGGGESDLPPVPSYAPTDPAAVGFDDDPAPHEVEAASPGHWSDGSTPPVPSRPRRSGSGAGDEEGPAADEAGDGRSRRMLMLLLAAVVLLGGGYLVKTQLLDSGSGTTTVAPRASASVPANVPGRLSAAELASSMKNDHFKHGYDWGKTRGPAPAAEREQICRTQALKERAGGYPWGAHDRAGCLVALAG